MAVFGGYMMGGLDCFCLGHDKSECMVFLYFVISNKVHR
jgi:hypothetical protein